MEKKVLSALYRFFRSVRLAVVLILIIAVLSIVSTLIPQGRDPSFYFRSYGAFWAQFFLILNFDDFFHYRKTYTCTLEVVTR